MKKNYLRSVWKGKLVQKLTSNNIAVGFGEYFTDDRKTKVYFKQGSDKIQSHTILFC